MISISSCGNWKFSFLANIQEILFPLLVRLSVYGSTDRSNTTFGKSSDIIIVCDFYGMLIPFDSIDTVQIPVIYIS